MKFATKFKCLAALLLAGYSAASVPASAADGDVVSRAYGVRVYHNGLQEANADVVSFNVDNPNKLSVEYVLGKNVRAAAHADGVYYMIESDDGMVAYRLSSYDIATKKYKIIREYQLSDDENAMIFQCMTYDESSKTFYAYAFDIRNSVGDGETLEIPFCLYTFDVTTGDAKLIGENTKTQILTLATDKNGTLFGINTLGTLYSISKETGMPIVEEGASYCEPSNLQSMAFDLKSNILYWAGFKTVNSVGQGFFGNFTFSAAEYWWFYNTDSVVTFSDNSEIVGLYIDSNPLPAGTPAAVTDLTLTPAAGGALEATLSWTNPVFTNGGDSIKGNLTVNIYRGDALLKSVADQVPGQKGSAVISETVSGVLSYTVAAATADGDGRTAYVEGYVGKDTPGSVGNITISKVAGTENLTVAWTAPTTGAHGGWFDTSSLSYKVTRQPDGKQVSDALNALTFTDTTIGNVCGYSYTVTPVNADGEGIAAESPREFAGAPLSMPFDCNFTTDSLVRLWKVVDADADGQSWYPAKNRVESFMKYFPDQELSPALASNDWLISAPMTLDATKTYVMKYWVRSQGPLFPVNYNVTIGKGATVEAQTDTLDAVVGFENQSMEQKAVVVKVNESGVYNIGFQALNRVSLHLKDVTIEEGNAVELIAYYIAGFSSPVVGKTIDYQVGVMNEGYNAQDDYTVELVDQDGNVLASVKPTEPVAAFSKTDVTISWTPTKAGSFNIYARIKVAGDVDEDNNTTGTMAIVVLENGTWVDVATEGKGLDGVVPFNVSKRYSLEQTIYNAADFGGNEAKIKGMMLYYNATADVEIPVTISFANTDKTNFNNYASPVAESEFTTIFNGNLRFPSDQDAVTVLFDQPFAFDGTNLCMMTAHSKGELIENIYFMSQINTDDTDRYTWYHFGNEPFDFPSSVSRYLKNRPSVSFFVEDSEEGGVADVTVDAADAPVRYFNLQGVRVDNPATGVYIRVCGDKVDKVLIK